MNEVIDQIYNLLSGIDEDLLFIKHQYGDHDRIPVYAPENVVDAVELLIEHGYESRLGLSGSDLAKFSRMKGETASRTIRMLAERCKTLLRELEGEIASLAISSAAPEAPQEQSQQTPLPLAFVIKTDRWVAVERSKNAQLIADLSSLLDEVITLATASNLPEADRALSPLERAQLVVLLETAALMLKGPLVETGFLKTLKNATKKGAEKAVLSKTELALGAALGKLTEIMARLLGLL